MHTINHYEYERRNYWKFLKVHGKKGVRKWCEYLLLLMFCLIFYAVPVVLGGIYYRLSYISPHIIGDYELLWYEYLSVVGLIMMKLMLQLNYDLTYDYILYLSVFVCICVFECISVFECI